MRNSNKIKAKFYDRVQSVILIQILQVHKRVPRVYQDGHTDPLLQKGFFKFEICYKKKNIPYVVTVGDTILIPIILYQIFSRIPFLLPWWLRC